MLRSLHSMILIVTLLCAAIILPRAIADEPVLLIGTIVKWRYPDAEIGKSEMADAATVAADGQRTATSVVMKTTMATTDSVETVLAFYHKLLTRSRENDKQTDVDSTAGRSVVFSDESADRPFAFHTILVNSSDRSTTLIITRGKDEKQTHITWKQYVKRNVGK